MNEAKDKRYERFQNSMINPYEEMVDDGRVYHVVDELQELNLYLQCYSKNGVIITGPDGSGKTALVKKFVQQNLGDVFEVGSIKVISLKENFSMNYVKTGTNKIDAIINFISEIVETYDGAPLILYTKLESIEVLKQVIRIVEQYVNPIKGHYNLSFFKFIFELSVNDSEMFEQVTKISATTFDIVDCNSYRNIDLFMDIITPRVDELSKKYKVDYTREMLLFYIIVADGWLPKASNINSYVDIVEYALAISKKKKRNVLERDIASMIFETSSKYLSEVSEKTIQNTAIHESGHTLLRLLYDKLTMIKYVSVFPGRNFNGVTTTEPLKKFGNYFQNREFGIRQIACSLAGRIAENIFDKEIKPNIGASGDLRRAMSKTNDLIFKYGFSESLGDNVVVVDDDEKYLSEETKIRIEEEKKQILKRAEQIARDAIFTHMGFIETLSDKLVKELVVSNDEVYKLWNEHIQSTL